ncbi:MAG TPA: flagellar hook-basal body complex protein, partial [Pseudomonadales bacterium]|nr:flagellar hook-basal body complex protein [Pseudomonadales bacterium]
MAFDIAISGMRAASDDLNVIGNNIANASTVGFKNSRAEFADVYAASTLGQAKNAIGSGVLMADVSQEFKQGSVSFTNNSLDMAINGEGFFTMSDGGSISYTRAGYFSVNKDGVVVNNKDKHLQGFMTNDAGEPSSQLSDITIQTDNINPSRTTAVKAQLNFPANAVAPEIIGTTATTAGSSIGVARSGSTNGYPAETITLTDANGTTQTLTTTANQTASSIASAFNNLTGASATASSTATLS